MLSSDASTDLFEIAQMLDSARQKVESVYSQVPVLQSKQRETVNHLGSMVRELRCCLASQGERIVGIPSAGVAADNFD